MTSSVFIIHDPAVITLESEKNGEAQFEAVDRLVRPIFEQAWLHSVPLFNVVSIETRAGCNYDCSFCPVSRAVDPRQPGEMSIDLITKIARDLAELDYASRICLFGNNEPLLDARLTQIVQIFHESCPKADLRVLTNGVLASTDAVRELFECGLSTLVINNYTDGQRLIAPVRALILAAEQLVPFDIRVSMRNRSAVLTTRAGLAPNKLLPLRPAAGFCALPFTDLFIGYKGDVHLCCFDAYGKVLMGNIAAQSVAEIWQSTAYNEHRRSLLRGIRATLTLCRSCDYDGFRGIVHNRDSPLTRSDLETGAPVGQGRDSKSDCDLCP